VVISFYGGEPLVNFELVKKIVDYVKTLSDTGRSFRFSMTTNALLLKEYMDFLSENRFSLLISIDGDREGHSYRMDRTGKNSFDKVFANITLLASKYPVYFERSVGFNSVIHDRNSVERTYFFIKKTFGKTPMMTALKNYNIQSEKIDTFKSMYRNIFESIEKSEKFDIVTNEMFLKAPHAKRGFMFLREYSGNFFDNYNDFLRDPKKHPIVPTGTCIPFSKKMLITVDGKILQCERINYSHSLGQIINGVVKLDFSAIAEYYNKLIFKFIHYCSDCFLKSHCPVCVLQLDDLDNLQKCPRFLHNSKKNKYIDSNIIFFRNNPHMYERILHEATIKL
ncbi:MAG: radical SAM peptide maturase, partial [Firmicutes bacterium]|nr:radical SAM peptide maturase [Bacillota bacterium]